jgi:hypothetical protein
MVIVSTKNSYYFLLLVVSGCLLLPNLVQATESPKIESPKCGSSAQVLFREVTVTAESRYADKDPERAKSSAKRECETQLRLTANRSAGANTCNNEDCLFNSCRSCTLTRTASLTSTTSFSNLTVFEVKEPLRSSGNQLGDTFSLFAILLGGEKKQYKASVSCTADALVRDSCDNCSFFFGGDQGIVRPVNSPVKEEGNLLLDPNSAAGEQCLALAEEFSTEME